MTDCTFHSRLSAFHDGELPLEAAREVESHVAGCLACAAELAEIRGMSELFVDFSPETISRAALARAHQAVEGESQPRLFLIAGVLAGLAASAMIIGSAWLWEAPAPSPGGVQLALHHKPAAKTPQWELVAMTLRADPLPVRAGDGQTENISEPAVAEAADWQLRFLGSNR